MGTPGAEPLLEVEGLKTWFRVEGGTAKSVDGVTFTLHRGETLAVVGESGSGKSVTSLSIMRLIPEPPGRIVEGAIRLKGRDGVVRDLAQLAEPAMRRIRGNEIGMIFQEPMTSLNPVYTVGDQIGETLRRHQGLSKRAAYDRAVEMLAKVGIPDPARRAAEYPHRMSGGMRQRVMIAMALACGPAVLIADEPTTALDVTIQAQILDLMRRLQVELGMSILFITHNLGVVAEIADRVAVMYAGRVVEEGDVHAVFARPRHPYTRALLASMPVMGSRDRLAAIPGQVPSAANLPEGCAFAPRCPLATDACRAAPPPLEDTGEGHRVRCIRWRDA
ncbi:ABC transporter ATP-binding protein [Aliidongia dinghuensis]|uniref:ABC transporter ATP-binding protein n=1 Tax=Aliidongia dinghuensis TaxID=1867774 RepID=A0A8J2YS18_9PROT|nr:ABC transporter ATP-binding protein [Aliidongia dinghuensis]